jgi:ERCC4-type nuclease
MIFIDHRIGSKELAPALTRHRTPNDICTLQFGDACWMGNGPDGEMTAWVGVERKRLRDLINSMESGRLTTHQLPGMLTHYHYTYVLVEGIWRPGRGGLIEIPIGRGQWKALELGRQRYTSSTVDNFLNSLSCMWNVTVVCTPSLDRTALWLSNVYRWWTTKKWNQHRSCRGKATNPLPVAGVGKAPLVARVAMELPGVGMERAMAISRHFPDVSALCAATTDELMQVEGVGKTTAQGIVKAISGK